MPKEAPDEPKPLSLATPNPWSSLPREVHVGTGHGKKEGATTKSPVDGQDQPKIYTIRDHTLEVLMHPDVLELHAVRVLHTPNGDERQLHLKVRVRCEREEKVVDVLVETGAQVSLVQMEEHIDDVCLGTNTQEDHLILFGEFFAVCQENHTRLKLEKCEFMQETLQYLALDVGYGWWTPAALKAIPLMDANVRHEDLKKGLPDVGVKEGPYQDRPPLCPFRLLPLLIYSGSTIAFLKILKVQGPKSKNIENVILLQP